MLPPRPVIDVPGVEKVKVLHFGLKLQGNNRSDYNNNHNNNTKDNYSNKQACLQTMIEEQAIISRFPPLQMIYSRHLKQKLTCLSLSVWMSVQAFSWGVRACVHFCSCPHHSIRR